MFKYLINQCPEPMDPFLGTKDMLFYNGITSRDIRWNWEKFLIGKDGVPAYRFEPSFNPDLMKPYIEELLAEEY